MDEDRQKKEDHFYNEFFRALEDREKEHQEWQYNLYARMREGLKGSAEMLRDLDRLLLEHRMQIIRTKL